MTLVRSPYVVSKSQCSAASTSTAHEEIETCAGTQVETLQVPPTTIHEARTRILARASSRATLRPATAVRVPISTDLPVVEAPDVTGTLLVLYDDLVLKHKVQEFITNSLIDALECPERILSIKAALTPLPFLTLRSTTCPPPATATLADRIITSSHDPDYIRHLANLWDDYVAAGYVTPDSTSSILPESQPHPGLFASGFGAAKEPAVLWARHGFYSFDMSTGVSSGTWQAIRAAAHLAVSAAVETITAENARVAARARAFFAGREEMNVDKVVGPKYTQTVVALCRPPGHHCTTAVAGGYCYVNNLVVAEKTLTFLKGRQVRCAVLDLDFHHGNGTQSAYYNSPDVLYVSVHGQNEYPYYTGSEDETGIDEGLGYTVNLPLPAGSSPAEYLVRLRKGLKRIAEFKPEYVLVSLGFDTYNGDPLGSFKLETEDYEHIGHLARSHKGVREVPSVIILEGGYVVEAIGHNMASFLKGWKAAEGEVREESLGSA